MENTQFEENPVTKLLKCAGEQAYEMWAELLQDDKDREVVSSNVNKQNYR